ncbi:MAG TPA: hypothetical protein VJQ54_24600 [Candidatus Sulfotelmatobacter sp.]|nr:hypothetical protein [Candidatus Sulfotelmatobacter sp.]
MKIQTSLVHLTALCCLTCGALPEDEPPQAHIVTLTLDPQTVTVLHLHPGFVSSVRLPEQVSSVVLGDPAAFKGEHSEAEPRLVFFKPASPKPGKSNALISTRSGREVSLTLVSDGASAHSEPVDYVLEYQTKRSFLISATYPSVLIGEKALGDERPANPKNTPNADSDERQPPSPGLSAPLEWHGKELQVAVAGTEERGSDMTVAFSIANNSPRTVELLPPQVQLSGTAKQKHHKAIKAEPVAVKDYRLAARRLPPGTTTEGTVVFERPSFKESRERLLLQIAQAEEVDRPVLAPIAFVAPAKGAAK